MHVKDAIGTEQNVTLSASWRYRRSRYKRIQLYRSDLQVSGQIVIFRANFFRPPPVKCLPVRLWWCLILLAAYTHEAVSLSPHWHMSEPKRPITVLSLFKVTQRLRRRLEQGRNQLIFSGRNDWEMLLYYFRYHNLLLYLTTKHVFENFGVGGNCPVALPLPAGLGWSQGKADVWSHSKLGGKW